MKREKRKITIKDGNAFYTDIYIYIYIYICMYVYIYIYIYTYINDNSNNTYMFIYTKNVYPFLIKLSATTKQLIGGNSIC